MRRYVLPCDVGHELLIPMLFDVQDEQHLLLLVGFAVALTSEVKAKLQWHIESRKTGIAIEFGPGEIMNAVLTVGYYVQNLMEPNLTRVACFQCASRSKSHVVDCIHDRIEQTPIFFVERTVDKNAISKIERNFGS